MNGTTTGGDNYTISGSGTTSTAGQLGGNGSIALATNSKTFGFSSNSATFRAVLTPGDAAVSDRVGILTLGSAGIPTAVTLGANSQLAIDLDGATSDKVQLFGTMSLNNAGNTSDTDLALALGATAPVAGTIYTVVDNDGTADGYTGLLRYNGTALAQGSTILTTANYMLLISYRGEGTTFDMGSGLGNNIVLQAVSVPEPASLAALALSGIAFLRRRR